MKKETKKDETKVETDENNKAIAEAHENLIRSTHKYLQTIGFTIKSFPEVDRQFGKVLNSLPVGERKSIEKNKK